MAIRIKIIEEEKKSIFYLNRPPPQYGNSDCKYMFVIFKTTNKTLKKNTNGSVFFLKFFILFLLLFKTIFRTKAMADLHILFQSSHRFLEVALKGI